MKALCAVMANDEDDYSGLRKFYPSISTKNSLMNGKHYQLSDLLLRLQQLYCDVAEHRPVR